MKHIEESDVNDVTIHHFSSFGKPWGFPARNLDGTMGPCSMGPSHRLLVFNMSDRQVAR
jgi:hypothetical protein